jgi:murein DD-endopeptidase MepM/ murein hydrolase activator NlpD
MTGGFLAAVVAVVLVIVIGAPEYGSPGAMAAAPSAPPVASASPDPLATLLADEESTTSLPPGQLKGYAWPVQGQGRIRQSFGATKQGLLSIDRQPVHEGLDIGAPCDATVKAAHAGKVLAAGRDYLAEAGFDGSVRPLYKRLERANETKRLPIGVVIDDGNGYRSIYTHLDQVSVKGGQKVKRGQAIGIAGQTGGAPVCMVQYELVRMDGDWMRVSQAAVRDDGFPKWARERVDPLLVLSLDAEDAPRQGKLTPEGSVRTG